MKTEMPEFKRCCCCLPLRYGILAWGYIKLIITLLVTSSLLYSLLLFVGIARRRSMAQLIPDIVMGTIITILLTFDICMTVLFLVGGHKKNPKLLRIYYIYSMVWLCLITLLLSLSILMELYYYTRYMQVFADSGGFVQFGLIFQTKIFTTLGNLGFQGYILLLIRSEIRKLKNNCKFRFTNTANEAECAMENEIINENNEHSDLTGNKHPTNGTDDEKKESQINKNEIDEQLEETIDLDKNIDKRNFNYTKL